MSKDFIAYCTHKYYRRVREAKRFKSKINCVIGKLALVGSGTEQPTPVGWWLFSVFSESRLVGDFVEKREQNGKRIEGHTIG